MGVRCSGPPLPASCRASVYALSNRSRGQRVRGAGVWTIIRDMGARCDVKLGCHQIRHSAITAALDAGADVRQVRQYARHSDISTTMLYDDSRADFAGKVAHQVADLFAAREVTS